jgi:hypothetical protein
MLWKHEPKLGDPAAKTGRLFNQVDLQTRVGHVQSGAHPTDATADHQRGRRLWV